MHLHAIDGTATDLQLQEELSIRRRELALAREIFGLSDSDLKPHRLKLQKALQANAEYWRMTIDGDGRALELLNEALRYCQTDSAANLADRGGSATFCEVLADQAARIRKKSEPEAPLSGEMLQLAVDFNNDLSRSHIDGNAPDEKDFAVFLNRDLTEYFRTFLCRTPRVDCDLFRKLPTQTGLGFPHYYGWLTVYHGKQLVRRGAANITAQGKQKFVVENFVDANVIANNPDKLKEIFPDRLIPEIVERAAADCKEGQ